MAITNITWNPNDPRGKNPVAGEDGHFDHHVWLKEGLVQAHAELAALNTALNTALARITALEQQP